MPDDPVRRVLTVLGCLASDPGLGGALLFDLDPVLAGTAGLLDGLPDAVCETASHCEPERTKVRR